MGNCCSMCIVSVLQDENFYRDFPDGPAVENLPRSAGDVGSIHSWGTKIAHATDLVSPRATTRESRNCNKDPVCSN